MISQAFACRLDEAEAMLQAEAHLLGSWQDSGWTVERQPYVVDARLAEHATNLTRDQQSRLLGCKGANLIAYRPGSSSSRAVIVGAHYDTVTETPGADDNTSGVAALLELGRVLRGTAFAEGLALVAFDMEEWNLLGSRAFVSELRWPLNGVMVYECIGYYDTTPGAQSTPPGMQLLYPKQYARIEKTQFRGDFTVIIHRAGGTDLARRLTGALDAMDGSAIMMRDPADLPVVGKALAKKVPFFVHHFSRSDHAPFWERGDAAVMITDTAEFRNPYYHLAQDLPHRLDYARIAQTVRATAAVLADHAVLQN